MDEKQAFELMRLVTSPHWKHFIDYIEGKQTEALTEMLHLKGEDIFKSVGKLKVYKDLKDFQTTVLARNEEYKKHG